MNFIFSAKLFLDFFTKQDIINTYTPSLIEINLQANIKKTGAFSFWVYSTNSDVYIYQYKRRHNSMEEREYTKNITRCGVENLYKQHFFNRGMTKYIKTISPCFIYAEKLINFLFISPLAVPSCPPSSCGCGGWHLK